MVKETPGQRMNPVLDLASNPFATRQRQDAGQAARGGLAG
jgi:hypothetical protein